LATYHTSSENPAKSQARRLRLAIVVVLIVIIATLGSIMVMGIYDLSAFTATDRSTIIVNSSIVVPAGQYHYYWTAIPAGETSLSITGSFTVSGGPTNDVEVFVMDQASYESWANGYQVSTYFDSGRVSNGNIDALLPISGTYYLIYSNIFSTTYDKTVQTNAILHFHV
jgi:hypothetical protein